MKLPSLPTRLRWLQVLGILLITYPAYRSLTVLDGAMLHMRFDDKQANPTPCLSRLAKVDARWQQVEKDLRLTVNPDHPSKLSQYPEPIQKHLVTQAVLAHSADGQREACMALAKKVDPQNALYPMLEANSFFVKAGIMRPTKKKPNYVQILKPEMMAKALPHAEQAMRLPLLTNYAMEFNLYCVRGIDASSIRLSEQMLAREEVFAPMSPEIKTLYRNFTSYYGKLMIWYAQNGQKDRAMKMANGWQKAYLSRMDQPLYLQDALSFYRQVTQMLGDTIVTMKICGKPDLARRGEQFRDAWIKAPVACTKQSDAIIKGLRRQGDSFLISILARRISDIADMEVDVASDGTGTTRHKPRIFSEYIDPNLLLPSHSASVTFIERLTISLFTVMLALLVVLLLLAHRPDTALDKRLITVGTILSLLPWVVFVWLQCGPQHVEPVIKIVGVNEAIVFMLSIILPAAVIIWWTEPKKRLVILPLASWCFAMAFIPTTYLILDLESAVLHMVLLLGMFLFTVFRGKTFLANYSAVMVVLLLTLVCGVLPFLTSYERQAWSRDQLLVNQQENLRDLERAAMHSFHSSLVPVMQKYRADDALTTGIPQTAKEQR